MSAEPGKFKAMISSTAVDLPEHRQQAIDACLRAGVFPIAMEHLPAADSDAIAESLRMVNEADIYIGIYGQRYGTIPKDHDISITEMEFNCAVERRLSILVFTMHKEHPITIDMVQVETEAKEKLAKLKAKASERRIRAEFKSPVELRGQIVEALGELLRHKEEKAGEKPTPSFHPPSSIPQAPKPYIAHPYVLLQTKNVIGRHEELKRLTDWITKNEQVSPDTRIVSVVAIGGMGKSALTWKWFEDIAPNERPDFAGRMWWSFYESDAHWENFIIRALSYTAGMPEVETRRLPPPEREDRLLRLLDERPFLIVLDGLERILLAYARMDAAHLPDDDLDQQTANTIAGAAGLPADVRETYLEKHRLRQCADVRAGAFLSKLARVCASRVLLSTRLYPAELQTQTAQPMPGCLPLFLQGLTDDDALILWRAFIGGERSGTSEQLLPLFRAFGNYPLLLRALAGEVAQYRPAPGDFGRWREDHPKFNLSGLQLNNAKTHVLEFALRGLGAAQMHALRTIAAFRMPAFWDALRELLVQPPKRNRGIARAAASKSLGDYIDKLDRRRNVCADETSLDAILTELEDRGLLGWNRKENRYDLHPIVRSVVWESVNASTRRDFHNQLHDYFSAIPRQEDWLKVEAIEDLTVEIELFYALVGLELFDDAYQHFLDHIETALVNRLSAGRLLIQLLEQLFPDGLSAPPRLGTKRNQAFALNALALSFDIAGEPQKSKPFYLRAAALHQQSGGKWEQAVVACNLASTAWVVGSIYEAEAACRGALRVRRQERFADEYNIRVLGILLSVRGQFSESRIALFRALSSYEKRSKERDRGSVYVQIAQSHIWSGQVTVADELADKAWKLAHVQSRRRDLTRAARIQGVIALCLGRIDSAEERLRYALLSARSTSFVQEELPAVTALAELYLQRKKYEAARELLDEVWAPAERGPYPLWRSDACNVLARLERDLGNHAAAIEAATVAYRLAWCDGPPFAYHYGLTNARKHLQELGAPEPQLPPFDKSKFSPLPDVELNPKDEFWVDPDKLEI